MLVPTKPCYLGDGKYPDASRWSVDDVVEYLASAGFKEESKVFHEQVVSQKHFDFMRSSTFMNLLHVVLDSNSDHVSQLMRANHHQQSHGLMSYRRMMLHYFKQ